MKLSDVHSAKSLKFKLTFKSGKPDYFRKEQVITIKKGPKDGVFIVGVPDKEDILVYANGSTSDYLDEILIETVAFEYMFEIENVDDSFIDVQSYVLLPREPAYCFLRTGQTRSSEMSPECHA